jgi:polyphosphate kinase 2 (PPK2 family)
VVEACARCAQDTTHRDDPEDPTMLGRIGISNRSYYAEALIVRVHPEILRARNLPHELPDDETF